MDNADILGAEETTPSGLPEETVKAIIDDFNDKFTVSDLFRQLNYEPQWLDVQTKYRVWVQNGKLDDDRSNYQTSEPFSVVEQWSARLYLTLFSGGLFAGVAPADEDEEDTAPVFEKLIERQFQIQEVPTAVANTIHNACLYGFAPGIIIPDYTTAMIEGVPTRIFTSPKYLSLRPWYFWWDPEIIDGNMNTASYLIDKSIMDRNDILRMHKNGELPELDVDKLNDTDLYTANERYDLDRDSTSTQLQPESQRAKNVKKYQVHNMVTRFDVNGDGEEEEVIITVLNKRLLMRVIPNYYGERKYGEQRVGEIRKGEHPYTAFRVMRQPNEFPGIGSILAAKHEFAEQETIHRQAMDSSSLALDKMKYVVRGAGVQIESLMRTRPGGIVMMNMKGGVEESQNVDIAPTALQREAVAERNTSKVTSIWPIMTGESSQRRETATTNRQQDATGNMRIQADILKTNNDFIIPFMCKWRNLNKNFLQVPEVVYLAGRAKGEQWVKISSDTIGQYSFVPYGTVNDPANSKPMRQNSFMMYRKLLANNPAVNLAELDKYGLNLFEMPQKLIDSIFTSPEAEIMKVLQLLAAQSTQSPKGYDPKIVLDGLIQYLRTKTPNAQLAGLGVPPTPTEGINTEPAPTGNETRTTQMPRTAENVTESASRIAAGGGSNNGRM